MESQNIIGRDSEMAELQRCLDSNPSELVNVRTWQHSANIIFCRISGYRFCKGETLSGYKYSELATIWLQLSSLLYEL